MGSALSSLNDPDGLATYQRFTSLDLRYLAPTAASLDLEARPETQKPQPAVDREKEPR